MAVSEPESDGTSAGAAARATLADTVTGGAHLVAASLTEQGGPSDRDEWLSVAGSCQALINTLTAVQDAALAEVARRESAWCEDGTLGETVHGHGRITLDAADLAAPVLGASHGQAQRRVELAVRLATGRAPVEADGRGIPEVNGLDGIHAAMAEGRIDGYRASVVADELELAPADVADAVVSALDAHLDDDAPALRRRARRLLARISPDLLRQRAARARASTGLRRWVAEPGVDAWFGTFPSEDAARAWAAIDRLAHELVAAGTCTSVEQARGGRSPTSSRATPRSTCRSCSPSRPTPRLCTAQAPLLMVWTSTRPRVPSSVWTAAVTTRVPVLRPAPRVASARSPVHDTLVPSHRSRTTTCSRCRGRDRPSRCSSHVAGCAR